MYRFADVEVDPRARELRRGGQARHLEPQAFDLLVLLIERRHEVIAKHDLLDGVWGHRFVSEAALTTRIKEVRRAVGDDGSMQHTIRNVRGRGYRFVAELHDDRPPSPGVATDVIGREDLVGEVARRFALSPVVSLVGPGGVGKSTLAKSIIATLDRSTLADGTALVELAALDAGDQVLPALARALDTVSETDRPERSIAALARLEALIVLDNCEHLVDEVAVVVDRIRSTVGARARVLATSRVRLGVSGEQVVMVEPLDGHDALALFEARARAVQPDWHGDDVDRHRLEMLVARLDRLPLAIEMAAARLSSMTFDELDRAVGTGEQLAQMTHRTPTRRHRSLTSLVQWSADLLPPAQRQAFVQFSVFAGAVPTADAAAVLGDRAAACLGELAEHSLLSVDLTDRTARFRMLETVKDVAHQWLESDPSAGDLHRRHAIAMAEAVAHVDRCLRSPDEALGRQRLDDIVAEVRQAHRWARDHAPGLADEISSFLHLACYGRLWSEPAAWSAALLDLSDDPAAHVGSRLLVAGSAANEGRLDVARADLERVLATTDDTRLRGIALEILSDVAIYAGRLDDGIERSEELRELGTDLADAHMVAIGIVNGSLCRTFGGDPSAGLDHLTGTDTDPMAPSSLAWLAYARAEALDGLGDAPTAIAEFEATIELGGSVRNPMVASVAQSSLASVHARHGDRPAAYDTYADCLRSYLRHGNLVHAVTTIRNLTTLLRDDGELDEAAVLGIATMDSRLRPAYGADAARVQGVVEEIGASVGPEQLAEWAIVARGLDLDGVVRRAADFVATRRRGAASGG